MKRTEFNEYVGGSELPSRDHDGKFAPQLATLRSARRYMKRDAEDAKRRQEMEARGEDWSLWA